MPLMILSRRRKRFALRLVTILLLFGIIAEYKCTPVDNNVTFNALEINNDIRRRTGTIEFWPTTSKNDQQSSSTSSATTTSNITVNVVAGNQQRKDCTVVVSDRIKGFLNWSQDWFKKAAAQMCSKRVILSDNKKDIGRAQVIVYHAPTHSISGTKSLRIHAKNQNAILAMLSMEQPKYSPVLANLKYLEANIDLMITYSLRDVYPGTSIPNMPITYFPLHIVSAQAVMQPPRPFTEKSGYNTGVNVAVFASNCKAAGASQRTAYLEQLMKHVKVHSYGKCFKNREEPVVAEDPRWPPIAQRRARKVKVLSNYKFYLAFENAAFEDYVSEKVFEGLMAGALPIYRGASTIHKFMPANDSFIDANSLSAAELGKLIEQLSQDERAYNKYFEFKQRPMSKDFESIALMSYIHPNVLCRLCNYVA